MIKSNNIDTRIKSNLFVDIMNMIVIIIFEEKMRNPYLINLNLIVILLIILIMHFVKCQGLKRIMN